MPFRSKSYRVPYSTKQKTAQLIYEPSLQGYSLKFSYDPTILDFIKKIIPSHKRTTSGPPDWTWYFGDEFFDIVKTLFEGHPEFKLTIVSRSEVEEMQTRQQETRSSWRPAEHSIEEELKKFIGLLIPVFKFPPGNPQDYFEVEVKNWDKQVAIKAYRRAAIYYHPDKGGDPVKMSELNNVWSLLKEGYYIK